MTYSTLDKIPEPTELGAKNPDKMPLTPNAIIDALITTLEVAMGRRPVTVTVNVPVRRGRTVMHQKRVSEVFMPDGRVAASVLKLLGQEVGMYKGASTPREPLEPLLPLAETIICMLHLKKECELTGEWTAYHQEIAERLLKPAHAGDGDSEGQS